MASVDLKPATVFKPKKSLLFILFLQIIVISKSFNSLSSIFSENTVRYSLFAILYQVHANINQ